MNRTALITGASEGIGLELARIMSSKGWNLILTARREKLLNELAEDLKLHGKIQVDVIPCDLGVQSGPTNLYKEILKRGLSIDALINNAGFGKVGDFKSGDLSRIEEMIQLNITSMTILTHLFIQDMSRKNKGRVMNVGSVAGFMSMPYITVYAATKAFVLSFSEGLARELEGSGITVTCLTPGPTKTGFGREAGYKHPNNRRVYSHDAAGVAKIGYEGMMKGKFLVIPGGKEKLIAALPRLLPRKLITAIAGKSMSKRIK